MLQPVRGECASKGFALMSQKQSQSEDSKFDTHDHDHNVTQHNVKLANYCLKSSYTVTFALFILPFCYIRKLEATAKTTNKIKEQHQGKVWTRR